MLDELRCCMLYALVTNYVLVHGKYTVKYIVACHLPRGSKLQRREDTAVSCGYDTQFAV